VFPDTLRCSRSKRPADVKGTPVDLAHTGWDEPEMVQQPAEPATTIDLTGSGRPAFPWRTWLVVLVVPLLLYAATANRGAQWQDSGFHMLRAVTGVLTHPLGIALTHPLHHGLARIAALLPGIEPCLAITWISAIAAAVAVACTYGCVWTLTRHRWASLLAAASLALAHTFWRMATLAEVNTLVVALLSAECWCVAAYAGQRDRRFLSGALLCNGLGVANHMLASLTLPLLVIVLIQATRTGRLRGRDAGIAALLWLLGSAPYTGLIMRELVRTGDLTATLHSALFGSSFADEVMNLTISGRMLAISAAFVVLNFPNLLLPAAVCGVIRGRRLPVPPLAWRYFLAALIIHACFAARYNVVDQHAFFLPSYALLGIFGGIGLAVLHSQGPPAIRRGVLIVFAAALVLTPVLYAFVPAMARHFDVLKSVARNKPYRDDYVYLFTPWTFVERSADVMSRRAIELAGEDGLIVVEDPMAVFAIRYRAIEADRGDLEITLDTSPEIIRKQAQTGRAVVLVPNNADEPSTAPIDGSWERVGDLYRLAVVPAPPRHRSRLGRRSRVRRSSWLQPDHPELRDEPDDAQEHQGVEQEHVTGSQGDRHTPHDGEERREHVADTDDAFDRPAAVHQLVIEVTPITLHERPLVAPAAHERQQDVRQRQAEHHERTQQPPDRTRLREQ
jgi:hypothetical protein